MTAIDIIISFVGFILCATVVALIGFVVAGIIWHLFIKRAETVESENEEREEESWD